MKFFSFFIKKSEEVPTEIEGAIETWVVSWKSVYNWVDDSYHTKQHFQSFVTKNAAEDYAEELRMARKLVGDKDLDVYVEKQSPPTNV